MSNTSPRNPRRRTKPDDPNRTRAGVIAMTAAGALLAAGAAAVAGLVWKRRQDAPHDAADLDRDDRPGADDRAPEAFRPDPHAAPTASEREGLAPATIPVEPRTGTITENAPTRP